MFIIIAFNFSILIYTYNIASQSGYKQQYKQQANIVYIGLFIDFSF